MPDPMLNSMLSEVFWGLSRCGEPLQNSGVHSGMHIGQRTSGAVGFDSPNSTPKFDCPDTSRWDAHRNVEGDPSHMTNPPVPGRGRLLLSNSLLGKPSLSSP